MADFTNIPTRELQVLLESLGAGRLTTPVSAMSLQRLGLAEAPNHVADLDKLSAQALAALLEVVIAERERRPHPIELVWTGPTGRLGAGRATAIVFRDLLASAQKSVWMTGYSIDHGEELFEPLAEAMRDRGVHVRLLLNVQFKKDEEPIANRDAAATFLINRFLADNWPWKDVVPELFYDPRTIAKNRDVGYLSMHAKTVTVDDTRALIGSANFTNRGQTRNIEAGALIHDPAFARQLVTQLQSLIDAGHIRRYGDETGSET